MVGASVPQARASRKFAGHAVGAIRPAFQWADGLREAPANDQERRHPVATFISLLGFTQEGVENIKDGLARLDAAKAALQAMGAELRAYYLTLGQCDAVVIAEAPDDETAVKLALATCAQGAIRSETMRAFKEEEYREIIAALP